MAKHNKKIQTQLRDGEELIWAGSPCEGKEYGKADWVIVPVSVILLAISALFGAVTVFSAMAQGFALRHLIDLALLLIVGGFSVYSYFLRFSCKRRAKGDLVYGVTNLRRVLIRDDASGKLYEFDRDQLKAAAITELDRRGVGTIYLTKKRAGNFFDNTGLDFLGSGKGMHAALFDIPDCEKVYQMITGKKA